MGRVGGYVPQRGDIVWVNFDPVVGHEQFGHRPAVVMSGVPYNARVGMFVVCPITNQSKGYDHEVPIPDVLPVTGVVLCDHIRNLDWHGRGVKFLGHAPTGLMTAIAARVLRVIH